MSRYMMIFFIAVTTLLCGCVTQQERIERIRAKYPQLDQESIQALAEGRIRVGMTEEMVITAKGSPRFKHQRNGTVVWEYVEYMGGELSGFYITKSTCIVHFQNKKVVDIVGNC